MSEFDSGLILAIGRAAVAERFGAAPMHIPPHPWLAEPAATFVTIHRGDQLHGCIGTVEPRRTLADDLRHNAVLSAFEDPRSRALRPDELELVRFSVSILGPHTPMSFRDEADARARLRPRIDGVILSWNGYRGLFLPKVWESLPEPAAFLANLKRKAGLSLDFWHRDVKLERFEVQEFDEPRERGQIEQEHS